MGLFSEGASTQCHTNWRKSKQLTDSGLVSALQTSQKGWFGSRSLLYSTAFPPLNCLIRVTVSGLRRGTRALQLFSAREIWASLFWKAIMSRPVSLTSGKWDS